jgi:hypothetical protein
LYGLEIIFAGRLITQLVSGCDGWRVAFHWLLVSANRRAMMASAPATVQCMPDCLRRGLMTDLQPASIPSM